MAVITVTPSDLPPVKYQGRIWIRTGPRRSIANEQEEQILNERRRFKTLPFDLYPVPSASIDDLSRVVFEAEWRCGKDVIDLPLGVDVFRARQDRVDRRFGSSS